MYQIVIKALWPLWACTFALPSMANAVCAPWLDHELKQLHSGKPLNLCEATHGKPLLLVNTASHCGFTDQFEGLQELHEEYADQGLVIIGFPSNAFDQAAANEEEAAKVCFFNFGVTFLMSETVEVTGANAHPVFQHLAQQQGEPSWNFNKYLVDRHGRVVDRYRQWTSPTSWFLTRAIDNLLL
jgi:glutathione peroxidase